MASHPIYQIHSKLENTELKIWRRFEVMDNTPVSRLAYILMTMYEMQASHLYAFEKTDLTQDNDSKIPPITIRYELPFEDNYEDNVINPTTATIKSLFSGRKNAISFLYDFGDDWEISLECERIIYDSEVSGRLLPRVIDGEGYGVIEDCGGTDGLEEFAAEFKCKDTNKIDPSELNPFFFDKEDMNFRLQKVPRIYRDIYEYNIEPTEQSMKILERKYK